MFSKSICRVWVGPTAQHNWIRDAPLRKATQTCVKKLRELVKLIHIQRAMRWQPFCCGIMKSPETKSTYISTMIPSTQGTHNTERLNTDRVPAECDGLPRSKRSASDPPGSFRDKSNVPYRGRTINQELFHAAVYKITLFVRLCTYYPVINNSRQ